MIRSGRDMALSVCIGPTTAQVPGGVVLSGVSRDGEIIVERSQGDLRGHRVVIGKTQPDDHNNPAVLVLPDHLTFVAWQRHGHTDFLSVRVATTTGDVPRPGAGEWLPEVRVTGWEDITYAQVHHLPTRDTSTARSYLVLCRSTLSWWRSTIITIDQGTGAVTWTPPIPVIDHESTQGYLLTATDHGTPGHVRFSAFTHYLRGHEHGVYYGEIDPVTLDVLSRGVVLGNLATGAGLPVTRSELEVVHRPPAGHTAWPLAVRGHPAPPGVLFASWNKAGGLPLYMHSERSGSGWTLHSLGPGGQFVGQSQGSRETYTGGGCYPVPSCGDEAWTVTNHQGGWSLVQWTRSPAWSPVVRHRVSGGREMYRPRPVVAAQPGAGVVVREIDRYGGFADYLTHAVHVPGDPS